MLQSKKNTHSPPLQKKQEPCQSVAGLHCDNAQVGTWTLPLRVSPLRCQDKDLVGA